MLMGIIIRVSPAPGNGAPCSKADKPEVFEDYRRESQMQAVFDFVRKVGPTNVPVLILGESGTGKEMVARALHRRSPQVAAVCAINCSAIPENLLESNSSAMKKARSRAPTRAKGISRPPPEERSFWTRSGICRGPVQ